ncbi:hypothetical protein OJAV_G00156030 [Oryzias javanicus]|uniref:Uncharacterized protein n=1 Tax=Oryzias javanicus TaxID=123683 RepID=A0A3S2MLT0_ORYJA|nr:hypothetical protein OJAV_G00156030 [Oryzias javanicus]
MCERRPSAVSYPHANSSKQPRQDGRDLCCRDQRRHSNKPFSSREQPKRIQRGPTSRIWGFLLSGLW